MRPTGPVLALVLALGGCGGGQEAAPPRADRDDARTPSARQAPAEPGESAEDVVRGWADDLRRGDVDAASARFAVPAVVSNNSPEVRLETRAQVRLFNASLPCGGKVTDIVPHAGVLIATFELTERPGGDCGSGTGNEARAAFEVRDGRIVRWLRVPTDEEGTAPDGPVV